MDEKKKEQNHSYTKFTLPIVITTVLCVGVLATLLISTDLLNSNRDDAIDKYNMQNTATMSIEQFTRETQGNSGKVEPQKTNGDAGDGIGGDAGSSSSGSSGSGGDDSSSGSMQTKIAQTNQSLENNLITSITIDGKSYYTEKQATGPWSNYALNNTTVAMNGDMLYAISILISNTKSDILTVKDILNSLGGNVSFVNNSYIGNNLLFDDSSYRSIFNTLGYTYEELEISKLPQDSFALCHIQQDNSHLLSSNGDFWCVIGNYNSDTQEYIVLSSNYNKQGKFHKSQVESLVTTCVRIH